MLSMSLIDSWQRIPDTSGGGGLGCLSCHRIPECCGDIESRNGGGLESRPAHGSILGTYLLLIGSLVFFSKASHDS